MVAFLSVLVEVASKARHCGYEAETGRGNMIASCDMENFYEKHCPRNRILNFDPDIVARGKGVFNLSDLMWGTYSNLETNLRFSPKANRSHEVSLMFGPSLPFVRDGSLTLMEPNNGFPSPPFMIVVPACYNICIMIQ